MATKQNARNLADESKSEIWHLRWIREPQQDRSARTRTQLLDATQKVLEEEGVEGLTIARVAHVAGCSVGSLYHHFQDKQTIVYAVLDRFARETTLTAREGLKQERWDGVDLLGVLEGYLQYTLRWHRRFPGVIQAQRLLALQDPNIQVRLHAHIKTVRELILKLLRLRVHEVRHPDPGLALHVVLATLRATVSQRTQALLPGARSTEPRQSDESFIREMLCMSAGYLGIDRKYRSCN